jgi:hypothetical protein
MTPFVTERDHMQQASGLEFQIQKRIKKRDK